MAEELITKDRPTRAKNSDSLTVSLCGHRRLHEEFKTQRNRELCVFMFTLDDSGQLCRSLGDQGDGQWSVVINQEDIAKYMCWCFSELFSFGVKDK